MVDKITRREFLKMVLGGTAGFFLASYIPRYAFSATVGDASPKLGLSITPGPYSFAGNLMKKYMIFPDRGDMIIYKPYISKTHFPNLALADGGPCLSCTNTASVKSAIDDRKANGTNIISYDFEHWPATPQSEQNDPVASVDKAASMAHNVGLKFMFNPDGGYMIKKAPDGKQWFKKYHWQNVDYCYPQTQANFFAGGRAVNGTNIAAYKSNVQMITDHMKNVNPKIKVWPQLSFAFDKPDIMIKKIDSIADIVDGIVLFFTDDKGTCPDCFLSSLQEVLSAIRPGI